MLLYMHINAIARILEIQSNKKMLLSKKIIVISSLLLATFLDNIVHSTARYGKI